MSTSVSNVMTSKTISNSSSIYDTLSRYEAASRYDLQNTIGRITQAKYHALNGRLSPKHAPGTVSNISPTRSHSNAPSSHYLHRKNPAFDATIKPPSIAKSTHISAAYYPVFQQALPQLPSTSPALISNVYNYSPSPTSSDWDGCSLMFRGDDFNSDVASENDRLRSAFSSPGSPAVQSFPTPCPSSPLLGPSAPITPSLGTGVEGYGRCNIGVLPERPDVGVIGSGSSLGLLMRSLESLRVSSSGVDVIGGREQEEEEDFSDGIIGKAWSNASPRGFPTSDAISISSSSSTTPSSSSSTFSFNPVFLSASTTSPSSQTSERNVFSEPKVNVEVAEASFPAAYHKLGAKLEFRGLYKDAVWCPLPTERFGVSQTPTSGWPDYNAVLSTSGTTSGSLLPVHQSFASTSASDNQKDQDTKKEDGVKASTSTPKSEQTQTAPKTRNPLAHKPEARTLYDCSCSLCHWGLLMRSGVGRREIQKADDEWGTLMNSAWRNGAVGFPCDGYSAYRV